MRRKKRRSAECAEGKTARGLPERKSEAIVSKPERASGLRSKLGPRALLFVSSICFGLTALFARIAAGGENGMTGAQVSLVRFVIGVAAVVAIFQIKPGTFCPTSKWLLISRGTLGGTAALLYFVAISYIPAGEATLLNNTHPIWAIMMSLIFLGERPTIHLATALIIGGFGIFLVLGGGTIDFNLGMGELFGILSGVVGGAAITTTRKLRATDNALTVLSAFCLGGLIIAIPFSFQKSWPALSGSSLIWLSAIACGIAAFVAQLAMTEAYGDLKVAEAAVWQQLTPIASYLFSLFIGETISLTTVIGVLLGIAGVVYGSLLGHKPGNPSRQQLARPAAKKSYQPEDHS